MLKKKYRLLFFSLLIIVLASCVRREAADGQSGPATEMRYGFSSEPATLDPLSPSNTADGSAILFNVFEGLVKPDTEGRMQPCLAESVIMDASGKVYSFALRHGVLFHDMSPMTSVDIKFSLDTAAAVDFIGLDAIDRVETDGDYGLRIILKYPDAEFLPYLSVGVVKAGSSSRDKKAIGTGPYCIESYTVQQSLVLKKFEHYWQENTPHLEKITILFFANSDALLLGLRGGGIDAAGLTGSLAQQLSPDLFDIIPGYSAMVQLLAFNNAAAPFNDIRVRQAVNYGLDIQGIIDAAFYGKGEPSGSPVIPGLSLYYEQSLADPYPQDAEKAISLLAQAGHGASGKKLSFEITVPSNYTMHIDTAQVIASQLAKIGIGVAIKLTDWASWLDNVYHERNYQATIISLDSPIVSPRGFLSRYQSNNGSNFINFSSADFDQVYETMLAEANEGRRIALYKEAQNIISENAASVYIQDILGFRAFRAGVYGGILSYPLFVIDFSSMYGR